MNPHDPQHDPGQNVSLPLPMSPQEKQEEQESNPAAELVRKKVEAAYAAEPDATTEALDVAQAGPSTKQSRHQQFIYKLTNSGKSLAEIQAAWHEYYAGLPDNEKHAVWQEFYSVHSGTSEYGAARSSMAPESEQKMQYEDMPLTPTGMQYESAPVMKAVTKSIADLRDYALGSVNAPKKVKPMQHVQSLLFGLGVGSIVVIIFLFSFFNERFIAPFIQPSRNVKDVQLISASGVSGNDPEIVIPKINVQIPVVYDVNTIDEAAVEKGLERGVVHYADTALPGQDGNLVIFGHSSNNIFNPGKYKFAFVLLSHLDNGDTFYIQKDGKRYTYQVYKKQIVKPSDVSVLAAADKPATATLITCDPPGTSTNRLVVVGEQIDPATTDNAPQTAQNTKATQTAIIPGNAPTLWSRFIHWFKS
jgi:LPXTG-site transpeptidase (sortase) family protein